MSESAGILAAMQRLLEQKTNGRYGLSLINQQHAWLAERHRAASTAKPRHAPEHIATQPAIRPPRCKNDPFQHCNLASVLFLYRNNKTPPSCPIRYMTIRNDTYPSSFRHRPATAPP